MIERSALSLPKRTKLPTAPLLSQRANTEGAILKSSQPAFPVQDSATLFGSESSDLPLPNTTRVLPRHQNIPQAPARERKRAVFNERRNNIAQLLGKQQVAFPDRALYAGQAVAAYEAFLQDDVPPRSRALITGERFQKYIDELAGKGRVGPYFVDLLTILQRDDLLRLYGEQEVLDIFARMDRHHFVLERALVNGGTISGNDQDEDESRGFLGAAIEDMLHETDKDYGEVFQELFDNFTTAHRILLDGIQDNTNPSWKHFALSAFPYLAKWIRFGNKVYSYGGREGIERARALATSVEPKDQGFLLDYIAMSNQVDFQEMEEAFDEKIKKGDFKEAQACVDFADFAFFKERDMMPHEEHMQVFPIKHYIAGKLTLDQLRQTPQIWDKLRAAYFSLPPEVRENIKTWSEGEQGMDKTGRTIVDISLWNSIMISPLLYEHPDVVAQVVASGRPPSRKNILMHTAPPELSSALTQADRLETSFTTKGLDRGGIIRVWTSRLLNGQLTTAEIPAILDALGKVYDQERSLYKRKDLPKEAKDLLKFRLRGIYVDADIVDHATGVASVLSQGYYPSPHLVKLFEEQPEEATAICQELKERTETGNFDPLNSIQRDLEYIPFLEIAAKLKSQETTYTDFEKLPFHESGRQRLELAPEEMYEAEAAAFEAANLFQFIVDRKRAGRKVYAVGNLRYGEYFGVGPMDEMLKDEGVSVGTYYIRSSKDEPEQVNTICQAINRYVERNSIDDVIIVDGTSSLFVGEAARMPRSLGHYEEGLAALGDYRLAHWLPIPSDRVEVGPKTDQYITPDDTSPQIILANPVIDPKRFPSFPGHLSQHRPGYLDNPEIFGYTNTNIVFTQNGVEALLFGHTQEEFIELVQSHMRSAIPKYVREMERQQRRVT